MGMLRKASASSFGALFAFAFAGACGGVSTGAGTCVTGQSIACTGERGCSGNQVCKADGTYDVCNCGGAGGDGGSSFSDGSPAGDGSSLPGDAGDEASTGDSGILNPADLPGLALWLNDTGIVTDLANPDDVVHWLDQSGNGNDATGACAGSCPGPGPTIDPGGAHGHNAIDCADSIMSISDSASLQFGTGDWALAFVYKNSGAGSVTTNIFSKTDGTSPPLLFASSGPTTYTIGDGASTASASVTYAPTFGYYIMRGPAMFLQTGYGSSTGTTATGDVSNPGAPINLCAAGVQNGNNEIAEVIAIKGSVSDAEVAKLVAYFKKKFGL